MGWLTFTSDYGLEDSYVGVCHGVVARTAPSVRVIDVSHALPVQQVEAGAATIAGALPYLPVGVHLVLVDPPRASPCRPVVVRTADGTTFVAPDNGVTSLAWAKAGGAQEAWHVTDPALWLPNPSQVFRGRDIFAPVAARLADGLPPDQVGPALDVDELVTVTLRPCRVDDDSVRAEVRAVDHFGNMALNASRSDLELAGITLGDTVELRVNGRTLAVPFTASIGTVPVGRVAVTEDAYRRVSLSVNLGHAAGRLRLARGDTVVITRAPVKAAGQVGLIGVLDPPVPVS